MGTHVFSHAQCAEIAETFALPVTMRVGIEGEIRAHDLAVPGEHEAVIGRGARPRWHHRRGPVCADSREFRCSLRNRATRPMSSAVIGRSSDPIRWSRNAAHRRAWVSADMITTLRDHGTARGSLQVFRPAGQPASPSLSTMTSVVIAAHNEASVIGRCLDALLPPDERVEAGQVPRARGHRGGQRLHRPHGRGGAAARSPGGGGGPGQQGRSPEPRRCGSAYLPPHLSRRRHHRARGRSCRDEARRRGRGRPARRRAPAPPRSDRSTAGRSGPTSRSTHACRPSATGCSAGG